jgi:hypothetical protein
MKKMSSAHEDKLTELQNKIRSLQVRYSPPNVDPDPAFRLIRIRIQLFVKCGSESSFSLNSDWEPGSSFHLNADPDPAVN